ncbi:MAG TPA: HD-GYP domain-containing protein [Gaiellaceae bacterium]|nr:HD-GYP domain-containing protein [Gaiellaceae bacterium]
MLFAIALPWGLGSPLAVAGLAIVAAVAERGRVRLDNKTDVSISVLPTVFAAAVFGPLAGLVVSAASMIGDAPIPWPGHARRANTRVPALKWGVYTCARAIYGAVAGFAAAAAAPLAHGETAQLVVATATAALVAEPLDLAFGVLTAWLRGNPALPFLRVCAPMYTVSVCLYTPIVAALAIAYTRVSPWTLPLFFIPALAAQRLFGLYQQQRQLTVQLVDANVDLEKANLSFATALVTTLDARDRYTAGHSAAVAIYARDIAERMGLPEEESSKAHLAGLVHDIGKIGLSAGVLEKPGALTLDERREMQRHSEIGERILTKVESYAEIASIVRHHHERVDGGGYPDGLADDEIPLLSRIIAVADAYNAMTSDRPYRDAMPSRVARLRLAQAVDSQFDTSVVAAFEAVLAMAAEPYRMARSPEFTFEWQQTEADEHVSTELGGDQTPSVAAMSISA